MTAGSIILIYLFLAEELRLAVSHQHQILLLCRHIGVSPSHTHVTHTLTYIYERHTESSYPPLGLKRCKVGNNFFPDKRDSRN